MKTEMTFEVAEEILAAHIDEEGNLTPDGETGITWRNNKMRDCVYLEGYFSLRELEAIITYIRPYAHLGAPLE